MPNITKGDDFGRVDLFGLGSSVRIPEGMHLMVPDAFTTRGVGPGHHDQSFCQEPLKACCTWLGVELECVFREITHHEVEDLIGQVIVDLGQGSVL